MKTIVIAHNYDENSFAAMSFHLANHLAEIGHRVVFMSHKPYFSEAKIIKKNKGELIVYSWSTPDKRPTSLTDFIWYAKIHLKYKPDFVIAHFVGVNITSVVSKVLSFGKTKTLIYYHTLYNQILTDLGKNSLKHKLLNYRKKLLYVFFCNRIICPSDMAKNDILQYFGIKKSIVVLNPITDRFVVKAKLPEDKITISFLGRIDASKGVFDLVKAYVLYLEKHPKSAIRLNIAGSGSLEKELVELVSNIPTITFLGKLPYEKIDDYLNQSHYAIIPSKHDNLPTVGLEAMMNTTPILISDKTGLSEYLTDGKDCYKFEPTIDSIIQTLERVEINPDLQDEMANSARLTFEEKFRISIYCSKITQLLQ